VNCCGVARRSADWVRWDSFHLRPLARRPSRREDSRCQVTDATGGPTTAPRAGLLLLAFCGVPSLTMLDRRHRGGALSWVPTLSKGAPTGSAPGIGRIEAPLLWPNERPRVPNIVKGGNRGERNAGRNR
jgi:hypothetical protein